MGRRVRFELSVSHRPVSTSSRNPPARQPFPPRNIHTRPSHAPASQSIPYRTALSQPLPPDLESQGTRHRHAKLTVDADDRELDISPISIVTTRRYLLARPPGFINEISGSLTVLTRPMKHREHRNAEVLTDDHSNDHDQPCSTLCFMIMCIQCLKD